MEPLAINPLSYGGTYKLVGGELSLDFVNTVSWPGTRREHDWFDPIANIAVWAVEVRLIDQETGARLERVRDENPPKWARQAAGVKTLREVVASAIKPVAHGQSAPGGAIAQLNRALAKACRRRHIDEGSLQWSWTSPSTLVEVMDPVV